MKKLGANASVVGQFGFRGIGRLEGVKHEGGSWREVAYPGRTPPVGYSRLCTVAALYQCTMLVACKYHASSAPREMRDTVHATWVTTTSARNECSNECNEFEHELRARVMLLPPVATNECNE
jgi:hypothetical protein